MYPLRKIFRGFKRTVKLRQPLFMYRQHAADDLWDGVICLALSHLDRLHGAAFQAPRDPPRLGTRSQGLNRGYASSCNGLSP